MAENEFTELNDTAQLDEWLRQSAEGLVILFKHSNSCPISSRAHHQMAKLEKPVAIITVQKARPLSDEVASRFELRHETPQVLIVRDGKLAWSASHFSVTTEAVNDALNGAA